MPMEALQYPTYSYSSYLLTLFLVKKSVAKSLCDHHNVVKIDVSNFVSHLSCKPY